MLKYFIFVFLSPFCFGAIVQLSTPMYVPTNNNYQQRAAQLPPNIRPDFVTQKYIEQGKGLGSSSQFNSISGQQDSTDSNNQLPSLSTQGPSRPSASLLNSQQDNMKYATNQPILSAIYTRKHQGNPNINQQNGPAESSNQLPTLSLQGSYQSNNQPNMNNNQKSAPLNTNIPSSNPNLLVNYQTNSQTSGNSGPSNQNKPILSSQQVLQDQNPSGKVVNIIPSSYYSTNKDSTNLLLTTNTDNNLKTNTNLNTNINTNTISSTNANTNTISNPNPHPNLIMNINNANSNSNLSNDLVKKSSHDNSNLSIGRNNNFISSIENNVNGENNNLQNCHKNNIIGSDNTVSKSEGNRIEGNHNTIK